MPADSSPPGDGQYGLQVHHHPHAHVQAVGKHLAQDVSAAAVPIINKNVKTFWTNNDNILNFTTST